MKRERLRNTLRHVLAEHGFFAEPAQQTSLYVDLIDAVVHEQKQVSSPSAPLDADDAAHRAHELGGESG